MAKEPQTVEAIDAEILAISQQRDQLRERSLELHARRDELLRSDRLDALTAGLNEQDRAALRERLAQGD